MKRLTILIIVLSFVAGMFACNSAKKAEAEQKRTKEKMEQLDRDKEQFEKKNP